MTAPPDPSVTADHPWIALPLDADADLVTSSFVEAFADTATEEHLARIGAALAGAAARVVAANDDDTLGLGLWACLADTEEPRFLGFAVLRALRVPPGTTATGCLDLLRADGPLHAPPQEREIDTGSGPATLLVSRPLVDVDGATEVHESRLVAWPRPEAGYVLVLSTTNDDLVTSAQIGEHLLDLAASVDGA